MILYEARLFGSHIDPGIVDDNKFIIFRLYDVAFYTIKLVVDSILERFHRVFFYQGRGISSMCYLFHIVLYVKKEIVLLFNSTAIKKQPEL